MALKRLTFGPAKPTGAVIWLHGLGASGHDFSSIVPHMDRPDLRFVLPHAPVRPVTVNGGMPCPSWYDIRHMGSGPGRESAEEVHQSAKDINALVQEQRDAGIPANRIALFGFSQGGAMALHVALRWPERLAAVVAMSTYLVLEASLEAERSPASDGMPAFFAHGTDDGVVDITRGQRAHDLLADRLDASWASYPMTHEVCIDEILDLRDLLGEVIPTV